jgi:hypothetical protein
MLVNHHLLFLGMNVDFKYTERLFYEMNCNDKSKYYKSSQALIQLQLLILKKGHTPYLCVFKPHVCISCI